MHVSFGHLIRNNSKIKNKEICQKPINVLKAILKQLIKLFTFVKPYNY